MITLTWNGSCEIGDGALVKHPTGLTEFGRQVVRYMEDHKMVVLSLITHLDVYKRHVPQRSAADGPQ